MKFPKCQSVHEVIGEMFDLSHVMPDVDHRHGELIIQALKTWQNLTLGAAILGSKWLAHQKNS